MTATTLETTYTIGGTTRVVRTEPTGNAKRTRVAHSRACLSAVNEMSAAARAAEVARLHAVIANAFATKNFVPVHAAREQLEEIGKLKDAAFPTLPVIHARAPRLGAPARLSAYALSALELTKDGGYIERCEHVTTTTAEACTHPADKRSTLKGGDQFCVACQTRLDTPATPATPEFPDAQGSDLAPDNDTGPDLPLATEPAA